MSWLLNKLELPLFARELSELASKKRTYVIRVAYAIILFWIGLGTLSGELRQLAAAGPSARFGLLGSGQNLFNALLESQMIAVHLFMPALACAAITTEKERNTLGLLLLTKLGPWRILFEKLFSRLLPMLTCLLLSVPILALAYTLGGLSVTYIINGVWLLLVTCVQVACLTLMCSTFFRSTVAAFIASYMAQVTILFTAIAIDASYSSRGGFGVPSQFPALEFVSGDFIMRMSGFKEPLEVCLWRAKGLYFTTVVFFLGARFFLIRRSAIAAKSHVLNLFKLLDRFYVWLNNNAAGGITLVKDGSSLPGDDPIAWREVTKKSLGTVRYLFRVFLVLEAPTIFICLIASGAGDYYGEFTRLAGLSCFLWAVCALIVTIKASTLIASERSSETLDVLLTTPLTSDEIVRQKCAGLTRVLMVIAIPLLTAIGFSGYMKGFPQPAAVVYTVWAVLQVVIYLPLFSWVAIWIGLRMRSQTKSIFVSMAVLLLWMVLPAIVLWVYLMFGADPTRLDAYDMQELGRYLQYAPLLLSGPSAGIVMNEFARSNNNFLREVFVVAIPVHTAFFGSMWFLIRRRVLNIAGRKLGRGEAPTDRADGTGSPSPASTDVFEPSHAIS